MELQGFRAIWEYESECARCGFKTVRIPMLRGAEKCFLLLTGGLPSDTAVDAWKVIREDESEMLAEGGTSNDDMMANLAKKYPLNEPDYDVNYLGKLDSAGFTFVNPSDRVKYRRGFKGVAEASDAKKQRLQALKSRGIVYA